MKRYKVNGRVLNLLTIRDLSKLIGLASKTIRKYERESTFPRPTIKETMHTSGKAGTCGKRYYTEDQAAVIYRWVRKYKPGKGVTIKDSAKAELLVEWNKVTIKLKEELNGKG